MVDVLFALTGLSDEGSSGHIANSDAFDALVIDFGLWRDASFSCKKRVFQSCIASVTNNAQRELNIAAMRNLRMVNFLCSLLCDQHEVQFRLCLTPMALSLLSTILKEDTREHELRLVAELVYSPSLSDEHNPQPQSIDPNAAPLDPKKRSASMDAEKDSLLPDLCDLYLKNAVLDMLLSTLLRIQQQFTSALRSLQANKQRQAEVDRERKERMRLWSSVMDLDWVYGVLKNASFNPQTFTTADEQEDIDAITDPKLHTHTAVLTLKLLCVLLTSDPQLRERFTQLHWHLALSHCLCSSTRHCLSESVYEVLLGIMAGKQILGGFHSVETEEVRVEEQSEKKRKEDEAAAAATALSPAANGKEEAAAAAAEIAYGLSVNVADGSTAPEPPISPSKLTSEDSPWDYLMFHTDADGKEVCDAYLFMPEVIPTLFALVHPRPGAGLVQ